MKEQTKNKITSIKPSKVFRTYQISTETDKKIKDLKKHFPNGTSEGNVVEMGIEVLSATKKK